MSCYRSMSIGTQDEIRKEGTLDLRTSLQSEVLRKSSGDNRTESRIRMGYAAPSWRIFHVSKPTIFDLNRHIVDDELRLLGRFDVIFVTVKDLIALLRPTAIHVFLRKLARLFFSTRTGFRPV